MGTLLTPVPPHAQRRPPPPRRAVPPRRRRAQGRRGRQRRHPRLDPAARGRRRQEPLFLQAKEAQRSVLADYCGAQQVPQRGTAGGRRASTSCRPPATSSWAGSTSRPAWTAAQRDFYVRQLRDWKYSAVIEQMVLPGLVAYAELCGWTLARAHARSGDRFAIAGYLGKSRQVRPGPREVRRGATPTATRPTTRPWPPRSPTAASRPSPASERSWISWPRRSPGSRVGRAQRRARASLRRACGRPAQCARRTAPQGVGPTSHRPSRGAAASPPRPHRGPLRRPGGDPGARRGPVPSCCWRALPRATARRRCSPTGPTQQRAAGVPVAWVTCDRDDDGTAFWSAVILRRHRGRPRLGDRARRTRRPRRPGRLDLRRQPHRRPRRRGARDHPRPRRRARGARAGGARRHPAPGRVGRRPGAGGPRLPLRAADRPAPAAPHRAAARGARGPAGLHRRGGRRLLGPTRHRARRGLPRGAAHAHRGLAGRDADGGAVARARRPGHVRRRVQRRRPAGGRLPRRRGAGPPARRRRRLPAAHLRRRGPRRRPRGPALRSRRLGRACSTTWPSATPWSCRSTAAAPGSGTTR